jgi:hypothetical protein
LRLHTASERRFLPGRSTTRMGCAGSRTSASMRSCRTIPRWPARRWVHWVAREAAVFPCTLRCRLRGRRHVCRRRRRRRHDDQRDEHRSDDDRGDDHDRDGDGERAHNDCSGLLDVGRACSDPHRCSSCGCQGGRSRAGRGRVGGAGRFRATAESRGRSQHADAHAHRLRVRVRGDGGRARASRHPGRMPGWSSPSAEPRCAHG